MILNVTDVQRPALPDPEETEGKSSSPKQCIDQTINYRFYEKSLSIIYRLFLEGKIFRHNNKLPKIKI